MALSKQDYVALGRTDAMQGNNRRVFIANTSWQAQCYASGWDSFADDLPDTVEEIRCYRKANPNVRRINGREIPRALIEHINCLHRAASTADDKRSLRLRHKVDALVRKWERKTQVAGAQ